MTNLVPSADDESEDQLGLSEMLSKYGFDREQHETIRADLRAGRIGLAQNHLPASVRIEDVGADDVEDARRDPDEATIRLGTQALERGEVGVLTLAAGVGSRWTHGAGVVKALNPFCRLGGKHRSFLDVHIAKARRTASQFRG